MSNLSHLLLAGIPGGAELWIVLLIILILFGSRLPAIARSLGQGISEFKKGLNTPEDGGKGSGGGASGGRSDAKDEPAPKA